MENLEMCIKLGRRVAYKKNCFLFLSYFSLIRFCFRTILLCVIRVTRFVCVEVLRPSQPSGVMSSAVSLPNHTFTGQA